MAKPIADVAKVFQALSDETRLLILERLKDGEQCVCDLTEIFKTGQSRLSFHLRVLKDAGLILARPEIFSTIGFSVAETKNVSGYK